MVDVDGLSDAELRTKLMEFGFPIMPITGTTRKIMVKKLKLLMENKNDGRRSLGRYSSEEESDSDAKPTKKDRNRRATMAAPAVQPRSARSSAAIKNDVSFEPTLPKDTIETTRHSVTTTTKRVLKNASDEFDTGSDSELEPVLDEFESPTFKKETSFSRFADKFTPMTTSSPQTDLSSPRYSAYSTMNNEGALDRLNQIRSRLSLGNTGYDRPAYVSTPNDDRVDTPFLSNFTRRLSQISSANSKKVDYDYKNDIIKEHDTNGAGGYTRGNLLGRPARYNRDLSHDYYAHSNMKRNNMIPLILVGVACLFFVVVAVMYYGMRNDTGALETAGYFIPHCSSLQKPQPGFNCVPEVNIENAIVLMQFIKPKLIKNAVAHACDDKSVKPFLTESEVIELRESESEYNDKEVQKQLDDMEVLVFKNSDWGISMVMTDAGNDLSKEHVLPNMETLVEYKKTKAVGLAVLQPDLPLHCRLYNKMYAIFNSIVILLVIFFALYVANGTYKYWKNYSKQKKDEVFDMVRRIIDVLESNGQGGEDFVVVNHVRDMILPIKNRLQMARVWDEAVKFINTNESRVRTEVQVVQGEPFEVWRWLGNANLSGTLRSKTWQGQAFETQVGSVNSLPCSPTPCLKIRGMMDDNDRNLHSIREAVLSKCAHQCRILHCAVDSTSKCVYLKCADQNDAAIAYRNLHGWWYSGHLVTVKYLRLERYMQRFPDSPVDGSFLKSLTPATDWSS